MNHPDSSKERSLKKSEPAGMPVRAEKVPPPALKEESYFPVITPQVVDISLFVDLLGQIDLMPDQVLQHFELYLKNRDAALVKEVKSYQSFSPLKPMNKEGIGKVLASYPFTNYIEPVRDTNSGLMALVCFLAIALEQKMISPEGIEFLLEQTESFCTGWRVDQHEYLKQKLLKGTSIVRHLLKHPRLDTLRKDTQKPSDYTSLLFVLRAMGLMVFTHYPHVLEGILPAFTAENFNVDVLAELIDPHECVSLHSVMGLLKACGASCLCLAEEGVGSLAKYPPHFEENLVIIDQLGIYRSGGHYYLLMKLI